MEELDLFKKRVESVIDKAYQGGVTLFMFLDEAKLGYVEQAMMNKDTIYMYADGGIINSDRVRVIISPYTIEEKDFKIVVFQVNYNKKFFILYHRTVLGALMNLGIKRECIGDIVITENKDVYFACCEEISRYIMDNFHSAGKASVSLERKEEKIKNIVKYDSNVYFVSSLRIDVIISAVYDFSRNEALERIEAGLVFINHILVHNSSRVVKENDEITVRHKGRIRVVEIGGKSKRGKLAVTLAKRV